MRILLVHHRIPFPLRSGMDKVVHGLLRTLSLAHRVTLVVPVFGDTSPEGIERTRELCSLLITVPVRNRLAAVQGRDPHAWRRLLRAIHHRAIHWHRSGR